MANTKGKIIIASGLVLVAGITSAIIFSHYRKKRILGEDEGHLWRANKPHKTRSSKIRFSHFPTPRQTHKQDNTP